MRISCDLENSLRSIMLERDNVWYNRVQVLPNYQNHTIFQKFLNIVLPYKGECFIPVLGLSKTIEYIQEWFSLDYPAQPVKLSYPLYVGGFDRKSTVDSIIKSITRCPNNLRLSNIKTSKGINYYGGQGLIFNEHWTPLMLCGFIINIDRDNGRINIVKPVCYVSPIVFDSTDLLSKAIIKKIIPYISMNGVSTSRYFMRDFISLNQDTFNKVSITIEFIDNYFTSPTKPIDIENLDDSIWKFLEEDVSSLI